MFLLVGLVAGWIASRIVEGHGLGGLGNMVVGTIGSFLGGFVFHLMGVNTYGFWPSVGTAVIGSILFLYVIGIYSGPRKKLYE